MYPDIVVGELTVEMPLLWCAGAASFSPSHCKVPARPSELLRDVQATHTLEMIRLQSMFTRKYDQPLLGDSTLSRIVAGYIAGGTPLGPFLSVRQTLSIDDYPAFGAAFAQSPGQEGFAYQTRKVNRGEEPGVA